MTVRFFFLAIATLGVLLLGAGCGNRDEAPQIAEIDEPFYVQGVQLKKQGRNPEALAAFLKVIEKRGLRESPESHVEVGSIYLNHTKDPILAYFHFSKYLELQPNSKQAPFVRGMAQAATREFAARIPGRPLDNQSVRMAADEELLRLRRENEELRAELATLRGGGATPINRAARGLASGSTQADAGRPAAQPIPIDPPVSLSEAPAPSLAFERPAIQVPTSTPNRPSPAAAAPATRGRSHTVREKDSLWKIAREHYGANPSAAQVRGIYEANRGAMRNEGDLRPGMVLRIP